jgi:Fe-S-cluster containining protein
VQVTKRDINRLAKYFGVTVEAATERYTKMHSNERVLRRKKDPLLGQACQFLDHETRGCTIYHARPAVCREYPDRSRCVYYDVLQFERQQQDDINVLPLVQITFRNVEKKIIKDQNGSEKIWEWKQEEK